MTTQLLHDPSEKVLNTALSKAVRAANAVEMWGLRKLERASSHWQKLARRCLRERDGHAATHTPGTAVSREVFLAWWTDPFGRKHVRVTGELHWPNLDRPKQETAALPASWYVFPTRTLLYRTAKKIHAVMVCDCGAVGSPQSLAWVGECCGPCADRRAEGGNPGRGFGPASGLGHSPLALVFTPDGRRLIASDSQGRVSLTELRTGDRQAAKLPPGWSNMTGAALTAKGDAVVFCCMNVAYHWKLGEEKVTLISGRSGPLVRPDGFATAQPVGTVKITDLTRTPPRTFSFPTPTGRDHAGGRFVDDGRLLTLDMDGTVWASEVGSPPEAVRQDCLAGWRKVWNDQRRFAFSPDGSALAVAERAKWVGKRQLRLVPLPTGPTADFPLPGWHNPNVVAFAPDRSVVATGGTEGWVGLWPLPGGADPVWVKSVSSPPADIVTALSFSPDGETLALGLYGPTGASTVVLLPWRQLIGPAGGGR